MLPVLVSRAGLIRGLLGLNLEAPSAANGFEGRPLPRLRGDRSAAKAIAAVRPAMTTHTPSTPPHLCWHCQTTSCSACWSACPSMITATGLVCRTFRAVVTSPQFHAVRRRSGFAAARHRRRRIQRSVHQWDERIVNKSGVEARILGLSTSIDFASTTDGARLFFTTLRHGKGCGVVLAVDASSRRWRQFTTLPH